MKAPRVTGRAGALAGLASLGVLLAGCSSSPVATTEAGPLAPAERAAAVVDQGTLRDVAAAETAYFSEHVAYTGAVSELTDFLPAGPVKAPTTLRVTPTAFCASVRDVQFPLMVWVYDSKKSASAAAAAGDCRTSQTWAATLK